MMFNLDQFISKYVIKGPTSMFKLDIYTRQETREV